MKSYKKLNKFFCIFNVLVIISIILNGCSNNMDEFSEERKDLTNMVKLTTLSTEEFKNLYPTGYNWNLAKEKGLIENENSYGKYLIVQSAYLAIFNYFLCKNVDLDKYQLILDSSDLNFYSNNKTIYAKIGSYGRNNISIRNNVFVERLSKDDINLFLNSIDDNNVLNITEELLEIVKETWKQVIVVYLDNIETPPHEINYDMDAIKYKTAMNNALTFEIKYDVEYDSQGNILDDKYEREKYEYVFGLKEKMEDEISEKLKCNVTVFIKN